MSEKLDPHMKEQVLLIKLTMLQESLRRHDFGVNTPTQTGQEIHRAVEDLIDLHRGVHNPD